MVSVGIKKPDGESVAGIISYIELLSFGGIDFEEKEVIF